MAFLRETQPKAGCGRPIRSLRTKMGNEPVEPEWQVTFALGSGRYGQADLGKNVLPENLARVQAEPAPPLCSLHLFPSSRAASLYQSITSADSLDPACYPAIGSELLNEGKTGTAKRGKTRRSYAYAFCVHALRPTTRRRRD
jgi:hypothetical protein